jgi:histidinol-phosphate phosphatase family protein
VTRAARGAVFLDRDGTLIRDVHFLARPEQVELLPGAADALRRINERGVPAIVATNQSGIARGYLTLDDYDRVRARMEELLAAHGARVDATYVCPHHPDVDGACECRKPAPGMYRRAAADHRLDLARSAYVGDRWRDVAPALALGGLGILVPSTITPPEELARGKREAHVAPTLSDATETALAFVTAATQ